MGHAQAAFLAGLAPAVPHLQPAGRPRGTSLHPLIKALGTACWPLGPSQATSKFRSSLSPMRPAALLALAFRALAVEAIEEAAGRVALAVTVAVAEVLPALQGLRAVLPGVIEVEGAVAAVPAARVVVALQAADLVTRVLLALGQLARLLDLRRGDVAPGPAPEAVVQDVAQEPVEFGGAQATVEGALRRGLTGPLVVAGVAAQAGAAGRELALRAREGAQAQAGGAAWARDARATVEAAQAAAGASVILARGALEALPEREDRTVSGWAVPHRPPPRAQPLASSTTALP